jgi:predicted RNase H-like HicB family nuclease
MQIPVLIEPVASNGYRARGVEPFALVAEGATPEEALGKLRALLAGKLAAGAKIAVLDLPAPENPWLRAAGIWKKDDPLVEEWKRVMEENRRAADADPDF